MTEESLEKESIEQIKHSLRFRLQQSGVNNLIRHMVKDLCSTSLSRGDAEKLDPEKIVQELYKKGLMKTVLGNVDDIRKKIESNLRLREYENANNNESVDDEPSKDRAVDEEDEETGGKRNDEEESSFKSFDSNECMKDVNFQVKNEMDGAQVINEIPHERATKGLLNGKYEIKLEILGGRSFFDQIFESEKVSETKRSLVLHVSFKRQRFYTKPVLFHCEPKFCDDFTMSLGYFEEGSVLDLLRKYEPIKFILLEEDKNGTRKLLSSCSFDWRSLLMSEKSSEKFPVTLMGIGPESQVAVGVLNTRLTILPSLQEILSATTYAAQINAERSIVDEKERLFLVYVKQWWREFIEIRPQHSKRFVKIFSYDENTVARPVQTFVRPIVADRFILTPFQAAWFVSLITLRGRNPDDLYTLNFAGKTNEGGQALCGHWQSLIATITSKSGGVEDHATLLCSLFLGFGLDAFVAIGTRIGGNPWVWVVTLDNENNPTFWESTTGSRFVYVPPTSPELIEEKVMRMKANEGHNLQTISSIFNDRSFYANIQARNLIDLIDWNLANTSRWKKIPECTIKSSTKYDQFAPELLPSILNASIISTDIEVQLRILIAEARTKNNLSTYWDNSLEKIMGQELARYEMEACCGYGNLPGYFNTVILKKIPAGHEFKGYPWNGSTRNSQTIFQSLINDSVCEEIILCRGNDVKHAIFVQVFVYPESIVSVRLMLACKYIPTE